MFTYLLTYKSVIFKTDSIILYQFKTQVTKSQVTNKQTKID